MTRIPNLDVQEDVRHIAAARKAVYDGVFGASRPLTLTLDLSRERDLSFAKFDLAPQGWELGKSVLALSALGIFSKLLGIDLSQFQFLGVTLGEKSVQLIPGFLGLTLIYSLLAFILARLEAGLFHSTSKETKNTNQEILANKGLTIIALLALPISIFVYSLPYVLGAFTVTFLWSDSMLVLSMIWALASK
ncbi:MAG: hypothetical protein CVU15_09270 [Betaproteobacteria bacterium HGW-Betaproteobacteria-1]|jgi:hypothetical protein|nr:MAG: hypothetical protein CVU15_09270 [Betaproteobacteria bacterium HGW-Betaproteobacteria-1]